MWKRAGQAVTLATAPQDAAEDRRREPVAVAAPGADEADPAGEAAGTNHEVREAAKPYDASKRERAMTIDKGA